MGDLAQAIIAKVYGTTERVQMIGYLRCSQTAPACCRGAKHANGCEPAEPRVPEVSSQAHDSHFRSLKRLIPVAIFRKQSMAIDWPSFGASIGFFPLHGCPHESLD